VLDEVRRNSQNLGSLARWALQPPRVEPKTPNGPHIEAYVWIFRDLIVQLIVFDFGVYPLVMSK
jgi:hypothetical protein